MHFLFIIAATLLGLGVRGGNWSEKFQFNDTVSKKPIH